MASSLILAPEPPGYVPGELPDELFRDASIRLATMVDVWQRRIREGQRLTRIVK